jgi:hypothetical protein
VQQEVQESLTPVAAVVAAMPHLVALLVVLAAKA